MKKLLLLVTFLALNHSLLFSQAPSWVWAKSAGGSFVNIFSICADQAGNSYITGYFNGASVTLGSFTLTNAGSYDMFVAKYDPDGNVLWARSAGGNNSDDGFGIAVDAAGNVYVGGSFQSSSITFGSTTLTLTGTISFYLVKYDPNGSVIWVKSPTGGAVNSGDARVAVDHMGNAYLSGCFSTSTFVFDTITLNSTAGGGNNFYIAKYTPNGKVLWAKTADAAGNGNGECQGIVTDKNDNVYINGYNLGSKQIFGSDTLNQIGNYDAFTVKYDKAGNVKWAKNFGGSGGTGNVTPNAITVDTAGNVYDVGYFGAASASFGSTSLSNIGGGYAYFIAKYDTAGNPLWAQSESGGGSGATYEYGTGVAVDANNQVYATSFYTSDSIAIGNFTVYSTNVNNHSNADGFLVKYDEAGHILWAYGFEKERNAAANAIAIDNGNIYLTGSFSSDTLTFGTNTLTDASPGTNCGFTVKLSTCGLNVTTSTVSSTCGASTGTAGAVVSNGTPPYTYFWTNGSNTSSADSLSSGLYMVTVIDKEGCKTTATANVIDAGAPTITLNAITNVTCPGGKNASITITVSGGVGPYTYYWDNGSITQNISNLTAGPYQIEVTDANGCKVTRVVTITEPPLFSLSISTATASCAASDGSATLTLSGGTGTYTYLWTPSGQTSYNATNLGAGSYSVVVTDAAGCKDSISAAVENTGGPVVTVININHADCFTGAQGTVSISVASGAPAYTYSWSNGSTASSLTAPAGYYNLTVSDASGCKGITSAQIQDTLPQGVTLCEVTVDSSQQNQVYWSRSGESKIASYNIYRETTASGIYRLAASQPYDSLTLWVDPIAVPQSRGYRYEISEVDSCGKESPLSISHKTIHLSVTLGASNDVNLVWDQYGGFNYTTYTIWRYTPSTGWDSIASIAGDPTISYNTYTDIPPSFTNLSYYIEVKTPAGGCSPTTRINPMALTAKVNGTKSNSYKMAGGPMVVKETLLDNLIGIYPNPNNGQFTIQSFGLKIRSFELYNVLGEKIYQEVVNGNLFLAHYTLSNGIYFAHLKTEKGIVVKKIVAAD